MSEARDIIASERIEEGDAVEVRDGEAHAARRGRTLADIADLLLDQEQA